MLLAMTSKSGQRYGLAVNTFSLTATAVRDPTGALVSVRGAHDMDFVHGGKKFINVLVSAARDIRMGTGAVNMGMITLMMSRHNRHQHGLRREDNSRKGWRAMDWPSAVRLLLTKSIACMETLSATVPSARQTTQYLKVVRRFVAIFQDEYMSLELKIQSAGFVVTFLRLWRLWVKQEDGLTL